MQLVTDRRILREGTLKMIGMLEQWSCHTTRQLFSSLPHLYDFNFAEWAQAVTAIQDCKSMNDECVYKYKSSIHSENGW